MKKIAGVFLLALICISFAISIVLFKKGNKAERRVMLFQSIDNSGVFIEERYIPFSEQKTQIESFINELVLGPITDRYRPVFPRETTVQSCFLRNSELYVELSKNAEQAKGTASQTIDAVDLLKKNVFTNFKNIDTIHIFIDGKKVYEDSDQNAAL